MVQQTKVKQEKHVWDHTVDEDLVRHRSQYITVTSRLLGGSCRTGAETPGLMPGIILANRCEVTGDPLGLGQLLNGRLHWANPYRSRRP